MWPWCNYSYTGSRGDKTSPLFWSVFFDVQVLCSLVRLGISNAVQMCSWCTCLYTQYINTDVHVCTATDAGSSIKAKFIQERNECHSKQRMFGTDRRHAKGNCRWGVEGRVIFEQYLIISCLQLYHQNPQIFPDFFFPWKICLSVPIGLNGCPSLNSANIIVLLNC